MSLAFQFQLFSRRRFSSFFGRQKMLFPFTIVWCMHFPRYFGFFDLKKFILLLLSLCYHICIWTFVSSDHPKCFNGLNTLTYNTQTSTNFPTTILQIWLVGLLFGTFEHLERNKLFILFIRIPNCFIHLSYFQSLQSESMGLLALKYRNSR